MAFSGDTACEPALAPLFRGAFILVHEFALGPRRLLREQNRALHSGAQGAAEIAGSAAPPPGAWRRGCGGIPGHRAGDLPRH